MTDLPKVMLTERTTIFACLSPDILIVVVMRPIGERMSNRLVVPFLPPLCPLRGNPIPRRNQRGRAKAEVRKRGNPEAARLARAVLVLADNGFVTLSNAGIAPKVRIANTLTLNARVRLHPLAGVALLLLPAVVQAINPRANFMRKGSARQVHPAHFRIRDLLSLHSRNLVAIRQNPLGRQKQKRKRRHLPMPNRLRRPLHSPRKRRLLRSASREGLRSLPPAFRKG